MSKLHRIYLDTAAATPLAPLVAVAMSAYSRRHFANPASLHGGGVMAARALAIARARIATVLGAHPDEIVLTSGGTEANNLAILGVGHFVSKVWTRSVQVVTTAIEHASVLGAAKKLNTIFLPVNSEGLIDLKKLAESLTADTKLISIIYAHNEIGTIQPIREIAKLIRHFNKNHSPSPGPYLHIDACQAPRFLDINVARLGVDLMTINAGKIYGPRGVGALYVRRGVKLDSQLVGGGQEQDRRAGTENVAGAIGLATALEICEENKIQESARLTKLRDKLTVGLLKIDGVTLNGPLPDSTTARLPNNVNVSVEGVEGEQLVLELDAHGIACSTGSACASPDHDGGHVIMALDSNDKEFARARALSAMRFTLGRDTTAADIRHVLKMVPEIIKKLRAANNLLK